uniref:Uncharacterized protein n=1 Tax=Oryza nivara TaxID=4536 RepID=A0A0E0I9K5_ORYNI
MDSVHFPNPFHPLPNSHQALSGQAGGEAGEGDGKPPPTAATWSTAPLLERPRPCRRVNGWKGAAGASPATLGVGLPLQAPSYIFLCSVRHLHRLIVVLSSLGSDSDPSSRARPPSTNCTALELVPSRSRAHCASSSLLAACSKRLAARVASARQSAEQVAGTKEEEQLLCSAIPPAPVTWPSRRLVMN